MILPAPLEEAQEYHPRFYPDLPWSYLSKSHSISQAVHLSEAGETSWRRAIPEHHKLFDLVDYIRIIDTLANFMCSGYL